MVLACLSACVSPGLRNERSLRAFLRHPDRARRDRLAELAAQAEAEPVPPGVRLAAVHHALTLSLPVDTDAWLAAEAGAHPGAARFLHAYRAQAHLPAGEAKPSRSTVLLVVLVDRTREPDVAADFGATLAGPLLARGWYVVPVEMGGDVLAWAGDSAARLQDGLPDREGLRRLAEAGIAACLFVDVRHFWLHETIVVESVRYDLDYALFATATGELLWRRPLAGEYERREPSPAFSDDDTFYYPSSLGPAFGDAIDFVRVLDADVLRGVPGPGAAAGDSR